MDISNSSCYEYKQNEADNQGEDSGDFTAGEFGNPAVIFEGDI